MSQGPEGLPRGTKRGATMTLAEYTRRQKARRVDKLDTQPAATQSQEFATSSGTHLPAFNLPPDTTVDRDVVVATAAGADLGQAYGNDGNDSDHRLPGLLPVDRDITNNFKDHASTLSASGSEGPVIFENEAHGGDGVKESSILKEKRGGDETSEGGSADNANEIGGNERDDGGDDDSKEDESGSGNADDKEEEEAKSAAEVPTGTDAPPQGAVLTPALLPAGMTVRTRSGLGQVNIHEPYNSIKVQRRRARHSMILRIQLYWPGVPFHNWMPHRSRPHGLPRSPYDWSNQMLKEMEVLAEHTRRNIGRAHRFLVHAPRFAKDAFGRKGTKGMRIGSRDIHTAFSMLLRYEGFQEGRADESRPARMSARRARRAARRADWRAELAQLVEREVEAESEVEGEDEGEDSSETANSSDVGSAASTEGEHGGLDDTDTQQVRDGDEVVADDAPSHQDALNAEIEELASGRMRRLSAH